MNFKNFFIITICIYLFTGCSYKSIEENIDMSDNKNETFRSASLENTMYQKDLKYKNYKKNSKNQQDDNIFKEYDYSDLSSQKDRLNNDLYDFYSQWEGVKYRLGGETKSGIDCSAFTQKAFKEKFDFTMPRTTLLQAKLGKEINKDELKVGDLVFFHTGRTKHVGIYMEDRKFIHASTKDGVTISDIDSSYFSKNFWKAQRIID